MDTYVLSGTWSSVDLRTNTKKKQYAQNMLTVIGSTINMIGGGPTLLGEASLWQWIRHLYKQYKANGYGHDMDLQIVMH